MRLALALAALLAAALPAVARPIPYILDRGSTVGFDVGQGQTRLKGDMPVSEAQLLLDFDHAANSRVDVTLDAAGASMGLPFATEAMKGDRILDTRSFPTIHFVSTRFRTQGQTATVEGRVTVRGTTRPVTLSARIFRPRGTAEGQRDRFSVRLTGSLSRAAFGASGFPELVGDEVRIDILARIRRAD